MGSLPSTANRLDKKGRIASRGYARTGTVMASRQMVRQAAGMGPPESASRPGGFDGGGEATGARRLGREVARALRRKGARLVLHFDLNKTIIMVDPAGGKTQSQVQLL